MHEYFEIIDFHSHIIPSLDHGCSDINECRAQLELMNNSGTDIAVSTPHFYPQTHEVADFLSKVSCAAKQMEAADFKTATRVALGAEVLLCPNLHSMEGVRELCIRGTNVMLLELPTHSLDNSHLDTVEALINNGITVVLAHIDRYLCNNEKEIDALLSIGAYAQVNADALSSNKMRKRIVSYLEETDRICAVGSDLHRANRSAYKKFVKAQKLLGEYYPVIMKRSQGLLQNAELITL